MPHTDSLTFDVMSPRHTFQECQARSIRPLTLLPHLRSAVRSFVSGLINFLASFPRCAAASLCPAQRLSCTVTSPSNTAAEFSGVERNDNPRRARGRGRAGALILGWHATKHLRCTHPGAGLCHVGNILQDHNVIRVLGVAEHSPIGDT